MKQENTKCRFTDSVALAFQFMEQLRRGEIPGLPSPCWMDFIWYGGFSATPPKEKDGASEFSLRRQVQFSWKGRTAATVFLEGEENESTSTEWRVRAVSYECHSNIPSAPERYEQENVRAMKLSSGRFEIQTGSIESLA